jgi:hypothetical protein
MCGLRLLIISWALSVALGLSCDAADGSVWADQDGDDFIIIDFGTIAFWSKLGSRSKRLVFEGQDGSVRFCVGFNKERGEASDCIPDLAVGFDAEVSGAYKVLVVNFDQFPYLLRLIESDLNNGSLLYITLTAAHETAGFRFYQLHELSREAWGILTKQMNADDGE